MCSLARMFSHTSSKNSFRSWRDQTSICLIAHSVPNHEPLLCVCVCVCVCVRVSLSLCVYIYTQIYQCMYK